MFKWMMMGRGVGGLAVKRLSDFAARRLNGLGLFQY